MQIKEVLALAAAELGQEELSQTIAALTQESWNDARIDVLLRCYHTVENEVALDYFPLEYMQSFTPAEGEVAFVQFAYAPVNVLEVRDTAGREVAFRVTPTHLLTEGGAKDIEVRYAYAPPRAGVTGKTAFGEKISARLLSFGVVREYLLTAGRYSESEVWDGRYRAALRAAGISRRRLRVRARRWA